MRTPLAQCNLLHKELRVGRDPLVTQRQSRGRININGERLKARQALEHYRQLRGHLQPGKRLREKYLLGYSAYCKEH